MKEIFSNTPAIITLLGALLVAIGTFSNVLRSTRKSADANAEQAKLYEQLSEKSDEIARLNSEIKNWVTGGDTASVVTATTVMNGRSDLHIANTEPFPLFDVVVSIQDLKVFDTIARKIADTRASPMEVMDAINKTWQTFPIGTMPPNSGHIIPLIIPEESDDVRYNIKLQTLSGGSVHQLAYHKIDDRWLFAIRSHKGSGIVEDKIPPELEGIFDNSKDEAAKKDENN